MFDLENIVNSVSDSEIEVLKLLWQDSPMTAQDIILELEGHQSTVKTLINRLLKKGAISYQEQDRKYWYSPVINKEDFYRLKTGSFLDKYFGGEVVPLISFFSKQNKLDEKDLAELKQIIKKLEAESGN